MSYTPDELDAMLEEAYQAERREDPYAVGAPYPEEERHCEHCLCPEVREMEEIVERVNSIIRQKYGN